MILAFLSNVLRLLLFPFLAVRRARAAPPGAYVAITLDGPAVDFASPCGRSLRALLGRSARPPVSVARLRDLMRAMAHDRRVAGLLVEVRSPPTGPAVLASIRDVLSEVRAAGKDVVAYLPAGADNAGLYLASAARLAVVGPETSVAPLGFAAHGRYVRRALDRLGIEPEVFAKGTYKSAGEGLIRETMSGPQREQVSAILASRHDALVAALAQGRRVEKSTAALWIDEAPHAARKAVERGMVDAVAYEDELSGLVRPGPEPLVRVPGDRYLRAREATRFRAMGRHPVLGVIEIRGPIVSRPRVFLGLKQVASEDRIVAAVRAARERTDVRGVVLYIDSPGGSALASDRIHHEVTRLAEVKPVVAYLSNIAASGGYFVAVGAHQVVAQPETVTGSIGVVSARFVVGPLLERLGVFTDVVKRGARADLFSPSRRLDEAERAVIDRELDGFYRTFLAAVARGRHKPVEVIEPLAEGRVYSGTDACSVGLVDHLGGFDRALHELRDLLGARGKGLEPVVISPPRSMPSPPKPVVLPAPVQAVLSALGLDPAVGLATVALHLDATEHILAYCC